MIIQNVLLPMLHKALTMFVFYKSFICWLSIVKSDIYFIMEKINDVNEFGRCRMEFFLNGLLGSVCFFSNMLTLVQSVVIDLLSSNCCYEPESRTCSQHKCERWLREKQNKYTPTPSFFVPTFCLIAVVTEKHCCRLVKEIGVKYSWSACRGFHCLPLSLNLIMHRSKLTLTLGLWLEIDCYVQSVWVRRPGVRSWGHHTTSFSEP